MCRHETSAAGPRKIIVKSSLLAALLLVAASAAWPVAARSALLAPGLYRAASGATLYVATEHELPDSAFSQYLDAESGATGALAPARHLTSLCTVQEERRLVRTPLGILGTSLFYRGAFPRATVLLIHGSDPETREMGWIVPYFVCKRGQRHQLRSARNR